jgi:hypothetical protein
MPCASFERGRGGGRSHLSRTVLIRHERLVAYIPRGMCATALRGQLGLLKAAPCGLPRNEPAAVCTCRQSACDPWQRLACSAARDRPWRRGLSLLRRLPARRRRDMRRRQHDSRRRLRWRMPNGMTAAFAAPYAPSITSPPSPAPEAVGLDSDVGSRPAWAAFPFLAEGGGDVARAAPRSTMQIDCPALRSRRSLPSRARRRRYGSGGS